MRPRRGPPEEERDLSGGTTDRRGFLAALGGAAAALALAGIPATACAVGDRRPGVRPIGLQLYTVRSAMAQDVAATLERVADVGYDEVEFAGYFDQSPRRLRDILDANGLSAPSAHISLESFEDSGAWAQTREAAETLGHRYLIIGGVAPEERRSLDDYRRLAERLERAGARAAEAGLRFGYHNHEYEFEPIDGVVPYDILAGTDPDLVALQLDLFWIRTGGADPVRYFRRYAGRFPSVHVKDMDAAGHMVDVGAGVIDWPALLAHADQAGVRHFFVEHDEPDDPFHSIKTGFDYLKSLEA